MSCFGLFLGVVFFSTNRPRLWCVAAEELACSMFFASLRGMLCTMNCCNLNWKMLPSCQGSI